MARQTVLLLEDDDLIRETMIIGLTGEGYEVSSAASLREFSETLPSVKPDVILLDVILPDGNGLSLIKGIREYTNVPVIVLSSKNDLVDKVVGLEMGADDYVGKPAPIKEVTARIRAQMRRYQSMLQPQEATVKKKDDTRISFDRWILDKARLQVVDTQGNSANLTVKEFQLLEVLVASPNQVFSREHILDKVRANNYNVTDRAIDVQIMRIRRKLGDKAGPDEMIRAIRGVGYMFVAETAAV